MKRTALTVILASPWVAFFSGLVPRVDDELAIAAAGYLFVLSFACRLSIDADVKHQDLLKNAVISALILAGLVAGLRSDVPRYPFEKEFVRLLCNIAVAAALGVEIAWWGFRQLRPRPASAGRTKNERPQGNLLSREGSRAGTKSGA